VAWLANCCPAVVLARSPRAGAVRWAPGPARPAGTKQAPLALPAVLAGKAGVGRADTVWLLPECTRPGDRRKQQAFASDWPERLRSPIVVRAAPEATSGFWDAGSRSAGAHAWFWASRSPTRSSARETEEEAHQHPTSSRFRPGTKFINLDVHDGAMGFGAWSLRVDARSTAAIIHDFGYAAPDGPRARDLLAERDRYETAGR